MNVQWAMALAGFAFVMSISPGPSNFLLLASGANFGFSRTVPLMLGISTGFLSMVVLVGAGLGSAFERFPEVHMALRLICGAYILWLAYRIARNRTIGVAETESIGSPISFAQGATLQLVNPKAWVVALIVTVSYTIPERFLTSLVSIVVIFMVVNIPSLGVWALSGAALRRMLSRGRRIVVFNAAMALLLAGSMIPLLLGAD